MIVDYIDAHRDEFGVEPICTELQVAPSTYYAARSRPPSARSLSDAASCELIATVHADNYGVYGARKVHAEANRLGYPVARCTVERLMRILGLRGISRAKGPRTTVAGLGPDTRPDLVEREFTATAPNQLWVADITYVRTFAGWAYAAFVIDVFSRRVVGWQCSTSLRTDLALDALEMGIWTRERAGADLSNLVHHSDRGVQYLAIRYTQRLAEAGAVASVGSRGGGQLRQRPCRGLQLSVQGRTGPQQGAVEGRRRARDRHRRVHRLVQPPTPPRRDRTHPTSRARGQLLPSQPRGDYRHRVSCEPPLNPGRDTARSTRPPGRRWSPPVTPSPR